MNKLLFIFLMFCGGLFAQEQTFSENSRIRIKLQTQLDINREIGNIISVNGISPAFQVKCANGYIHQIEISGLRFSSSSVPSLATRNFYLAAAYEFSIPIGLFQNKEKWYPYFGLGVSTTGSIYTYNPTTSIRFRQTGTRFITKIYMLPSLQQKINERLFMDYALLINIGDFTISRKSNENPSVPINLQRNTVVARDFFNFQQYGFRFGLGLRL